MLLGENIPFHRILRTSSNIIHILQGATMQVISYVVQAPAPPFPVFVLSYVALGFAISIQVFEIERT